MKLYVKATSSYRSDLEDIVIKKELKSHYKIDTRRKDDFIYAGLLGALRLREKIKMKEDDELYLTSGIGNLNIVKVAREYMYEKKEVMKLFDFINILGNTTSFYVASELGIKAKALFEISDHFAYFHTLINIYASLSASKADAILGAIDIVSEDEEVIQRVLGITQDVSVVSSVSYQKLTRSKENALCELEFDTEFYTLAQTQEIIKQENLKVVCSLRCKALECEQPLHFFETFGASVVNEAMEHKEETLFIECYDEKYKILKIRGLK